MAPTRLAAEGVSMSFGGVNALSDVSLRLRPGQWAGLIGPNGSGKSTLLNVLSGVYLPTGGKVLHEGRDITSTRPRHRARLSILRTFQHPQLATSLTIADNVAIGAQKKHGWFRSGDEAETVRKALSLFGLLRYAEMLPGEAPYGARKLAELARGAAAGPTVFLLDEPAAGLSSEERSELVASLRQFRDGYPDVAVCLVEHDVALVRALVDDLLVLDSGRVLSEGAPEDVLDDERVRAVYLGKAAAAAEPLVGEGRI